MEFDVKKNIEVWEQVFKNQEWGKYPPVPLIRFIAKNYYNIPERDNIRILELGCGTGANLWYLAREGFMVYGLEGSRTAVDILRKRFKEEKLEDRIAKILVGDYLELLDEFPDNYFDCIIDIESLSCNPFPCAEKAIIKAFNKLKLNGKMLSISFAKDTWGLTDADEVDYHAVLPKEGPMKDKGLTRYLTYDDIFKLYKTESTQIDFIERQDYWYDYPDKTKVVSEWIIAVRKVK